EVVVRVAERRTERDRPLEPRDRLRDTPRDEAGDAQVVEQRRVVRRHARCLEQERPRLLVPPSAEQAARAELNARGRRLRSRASDRTAADLELATASARASVVAPRF